MLLLTRQIGEKITIGDDIVVEIIAIMGDRVRLGIEAPRAIPIDYRKDQRKESA